MKKHFIFKLLIILSLFLFLLPLSPSAQCIGDFNGDNKVNFSDLLIFAIAYNTISTDAKYNPACDLNKDNTINFSDLLIFAVNYGNDCGPIIRGMVVSDAGGPPVGGSLVEINEGNTNIASATTDTNGEFEITGLTEGIYDVVVTQPQSDWAASKVQNVPVFDNQTTEVELIQMKKNVPFWETNPPTITVTGIEDGKTYSGTIKKINISIQGEREIKYLFIAIDRIPNELEYDDGYYRETEVEIYDFDTTYFPDGEHKIYFVAYDMNYNRSQLCITVIANNNNNSGTKPGVPTYVWPLSITLGKNAGIFSIERDNLINSNSAIKGFDSFVPLRNDRRIDLNTIINAAHPDSNIIVEIEWDYVSNTDGYKIYRKFEGEQNYKYIGMTPWYNNDYHDTSPQLAVGRKVYYQVSAFNIYGESEKSAAEWTTPIEKFNVELLSPADGETAVSLTPTLRWQPEKIVGEWQNYRWYIMGKNDDVSTCEGSEWNTTCCEISEPLQSLKVYEWNIYFAYAYDDYDFNNFPNYRAISYAGFRNTGALNGSFEFTTGTGP